MFGPEFTDSVEIGRGAFSTVYRVRSTLFARHVAIKLLVGRLSDERLARAFERECEAVGRLSDHTHVVTVHGTGRTSDDRPFIVMQHYPQGSLADVAHRQGPLTLAEALLVVRDIGSALAAAHAANLTHRDVKPHNVLVDGTGSVALGDFGIARPNHSHTSAVLATRAFAPPEVIRDGKASPLSDLYSLAATFVWLISGHEPHQPRVGESEFHYMARIITDDPDPFGESLPPAVVDRVRGALARDPAHRPQTVEGFVHDLLSAATAAGTVPADRLRIVSDPRGASGPSRIADDDSVATVLRAPSDRPTSARRIRTATLMSGGVAAILLAAATAVGVAGSGVPPGQGNGHRDTPDSAATSPSRAASELPVMSPGPTAPTASLPSTSATATATASGSKPAVAARQSAKSVPQVAAMTRTAAMQALQKAGFRVTVDTTRVSSRYAAGRVSSTVPAAGTRAGNGSTVRLRLSRGHPSAAATTDNADLDLRELFPRFGEP